MTMQDYGIFLLLWPLSGLILGALVCLWAGFRGVYLNELDIRDEGLALGPLILIRIVMIEAIRHKRRVRRPRRK